jgi:hypothetical protein
VAPNPVWSVFDFAVLVVNPGTAASDITVRRGATTTATDNVAPGSAKLIYLPWVAALKGLDLDMSGGVTQPNGTTLVAGGAYQLTATAPIAAYQFSPAESSGTGGPPGKSWTTCPGNTSSLGCVAISADSSLLFPTTALGETYVVPGTQGYSAAGLGPYLVVTATASATKVTVTAPVPILGGGPILPEPAGQPFDIMLDAGDVAVLSASASNNLAGTSLAADKPIQVLSGVGCAEEPVGTTYCDHLEETVLPVAALGKHYLVPQPHGPHGNEVEHVVQLVGQVDGTSLTYPGGVPPGAPAIISAGQAVTLLATSAFEMQATWPVAVASFLVGSTVVDPSGGGLGDPSMRTVVPVEQFRTMYALSLAPGWATTDLEVVLPMSAHLTLDGTAVSAVPASFGAGGFGVVHLSPSTTTTALHTLEADQPFGVQVVGYDVSVSYAHPGGMNLGPLP